MRWSKLKKRVEFFFADSVRGRVELRAVCYHNAHDDEGRGYITIDGREVWSACSLTFYVAHFRASKLLPGANKFGMEQSIAVDDELLQRAVYHQGHFYRSLEQYCSASIESNLDSTDILVRALALLDRRVGKRTLSRQDVSNEHELVQLLYRFRCEVEHLGTSIPAVGGSTNRGSIELDQHVGFEVQ